MVDVFNINLFFDDEDVEKFGIMVIGENDIEFQVVKMSDYYEFLLDVFVVSLLKENFVLIVFEFYIEFLEIGREILCFWDYFFNLGNFECIKDEFGIVLLCNVFELLIVFLVYDNIV